VLGLTYSCKTASTTELRGGISNRTHGSRRSSIEVRDLTLNLWFDFMDVIDETFYSVALEIVSKNQTTERKNASKEDEETTADFRASEQGITYRNG